MGHGRKGRCPLHRSPSSCTRKSDVGEKHCASGGRQMESQKDPAVGTIIHGLHPHPRDTAQERKKNTEVSSTD